MVSSLNAKIHIRIPDIDISLNRMFIVALLAAAAMATQAYYFTNAAAGLVEKLTCRSFRAMLRQEGESEAMRFRAKP